MDTTSTRIGAKPCGRVRPWLAVAAIAAGGIVSGCGSGAAGKSSSATAASASSTTTAASGVARAQAVVASYEREVTTYPLPTQSIKGVGAAKGKTVMYIPLIQTIPAFAITASAMKQALAHVGAHLVVCNGGANPTTTAACLSQAVSSHYAAVVTDAIPYGLAAHAFHSAAAAGVHVLIGDQLPQAGTADADKLNYITGPENVAALIAEWITVDSKGKGNVVVAEEADSPTSKAIVEQYMRPVFARDCPGCTVKIINSTASTPEQLAGSVSSTVSATPGIEYWYEEFEDDLQGTLQGLQQAGKINSVKLTSATATIAGLSKMKAGQTMAAETGVDINYEGWAFVDTVLRMITGAPVHNETIPTRLFTRQNVGSITLTPAAQATGEWYGNPNTFKQGFLKLWGAH